MKAKLSNYRQSPRKVRLVTDLVKGKKVTNALTELSFLPKRASLPVEKLVRSAVAAAKEQGKDVENLKIQNIEVNEGAVLKRIMPRARGSASRINKRTSHVTVTLSEVVESPNKAKATKAKAKSK
jgi:large subunit ribosomal protein L22